MPHSAREGLEDEEATVSEDQCDPEKDWKMRRPLLVKTSVIPRRTGR